MLKNTKISNNSGIRFKLGSLVDLETIIACENIGSSLKHKVDWLRDIKSLEKLKY